MKEFVEEKNEEKDKEQETSWDCKSKGMEG